MFWELLWEWRFVVICIVAAILWAILEWEKAKAILYDLMLQAKRKAKDAILKSGREQEEWVLKMALQLLPLPLKIFLSEDNIRKIIRWLYHKARDYLDDGQFNNSIA